jgi:hypothetical protein
MNALMTTVEAATGDILGRRWMPDTPPEPLRRTRHHCGVAVLEVSANGWSAHGIELLLRETLTRTLGPEVSFELNSQGAPDGSGVHHLSVVIWDVGALALTMLARRLELAVETTVPWAPVDVGCAVGRDTCPEQLLVRAQRALARRRAERVRRRIRVGAVAL